MKKRAGMKSVGVPPKNHVVVLKAVKERTRASKTKAALAVNSELEARYRRTGRETIERQDKGGWGRKVMERLVKDLHREFLGVNGLPERMWKDRFRDADKKRTTHPSIRIPADRQGEGKSWSKGFPAGRDASKPSMVPMRQVPDVQAGPAGDKKGSEPAT